MKTLNIFTSGIGHNKFVFKTDKFSFSHFVDLVNIKPSMQIVDNYIHPPEGFRLSKMAMEEITNNVKAVR